MTCLHNITVMSSFKNGCSTRVVVNAKRRKKTKVPYLILYFYLNYENHFRRQFRLARRRLRDGANPFDLPNFSFLKLFRLSKDAPRYLTNTLAPHMNNVLRQTGIPNYLKVLCSLHFYGHGS